MGVVATLLKQVPAAAKYKTRLQAMESELTHLRAENAALKDELAQYLEQWDTLDGPQVLALQYLAQHAEGQATAIAKAAQMNVQIAASSLTFLAQHRYVAAASAAKRGTSARFKIAPKGARYLRSRGMM